MAKKPTYKELEQEVKKLKKEVVKLERAGEMLKYEANEFVGNPKFWADHIHPEDRPRVFADLPRVFEHGYYTHEYRFQEKDGTYRWMHDELRLLRDGKGNPIEIVGYWIDITRRKQAQEALRESEKKYRTLFEASIDGILITDIETRTFRFANPALCKLLGYSEEEIKSSKMSDVHPKGELDFIMSEFEAHANGEKTSAENIPFVKKDGTIVYVDITGKPAFIDGENCSIGFLRDVTQRKRSEKELRIKDNAIASSINAIAFSDLEGKLTYVNDAFLQLWGYKEKGVLGKPAVRFWKTKKKAAEVIDALRARGNWTGELTAKRKNGSLFPAQLSASMVRGEDGKPMCMMGSFVDITDRKLAEEALREREATLEIRTHELEELNTALTVLLKRREVDKTEVEEKVLLNVKELVVPYAEKLKKTSLDKKQIAYLNVLESNLNNIISPFTYRLSSKYLGLTPKEIHIASLVKDGKTAKEIARLFDVSVRTIEFHRKSIRAKIGLKNSKINLRSRLLSM
jgi:PAS domain S-box-containing protein